MVAEDEYFGFGLSDKDCKPLRPGDSVKFLSNRCVLKLKIWNDPDAGMVKRIEIAGGGYWLTPYSASMCERIG